MRGDVIFLWSSIKHFKMKKIIVLSLILAMAFGGLKAQSGNGRFTPEQKKEMKAKMEAYRAELNLTDEQAEKVEVINSNFFEKLQSIRSGNGSRLEKYRELKDAANERDSRMKQVLTKDQYKIYKKHQKEMKSEMKSRRG